MFLAAAEGYLCEFGTLKKRVAEVNVYATLMVKSEFDFLGQKLCF